MRLYSAAAVLALCAIHNANAFAPSQKQKVTLSPLFSSTLDYGVSDQTSGARSSPFSSSTNGPPPFPPSSFPREKAGVGVEAAKALEARLAALENSSELRPSKSYEEPGSRSSFPAPSFTNKKQTNDRPAVGGGLASRLAAALKPQQSMRSPSSSMTNSRTSSVDRSTTPAYDNEDERSYPEKIRETALSIKVQGGSLKTFSYNSPLVEHVKVCLGSPSGRPMDANVELWQGPDNTPHKMRVYSENGDTRPFSAMIGTPRGPNTIAIRNTGQLEFPMTADVAADTEEMMTVLRETSQLIHPPMTIQGGALRTFPFDPHVASVQVLLMTDGRPLNARIELMQGPNNNKQVLELYTEDGMDRPFYAVLETPGSGNVIRIVNTATVEFPLTAQVEPYLVDDSDVAMGLEPMIGGDLDGFRW